MSGDGFHRNRKPAPGVLPAFNGETERLYDLVRYQRAELHEAGLITDEEYGAMMSDKGASRKRLETYDNLRTALAAKERENGEQALSYQILRASHTALVEQMTVEAELLKELYASRDEAVRLLRRAKLYLENGDFRNGVTDQSGQIDQGALWAHDFHEEVEHFILATERRT